MFYLFQDVTIEIGTNMPEKKFFLIDEKYSEETELITDLSTIDINKVGDYEVELAYKGRKQNVQLHLVDTTKPEVVFQDVFKNIDYEINPQDFVKDPDTKAPTLTLKNVTIYKGQNKKITKDSFIVKAEDASGKVTTTLKTTTLNTDKIGTQKVEIEAVDKNNNKVTKTANLVVKEDTVGPVISGLSDKTVAKHSTVNYTTGVSAKDAVDGKVTFTVDSSKVNIYQGILRVLWGMMKKFIIAGRIGIVLATITGDMDTYRGAYALLAMLLYGIELYADFSGGIDMVLGVSRIFGVILPENFNSPYLSENVKEFWRRWHITLSAWLKDYIYIPLGGNRCSKVRNKINVVITFLVSGFWHGINYIVWGLVHGILVAFGDYKTKWKNLNRIINYLIISFTWSFFIWPNTVDALKMVLSVFTTFNFGDMLSQLTNLGLNIVNIIVLIIFTVLLFIFDCNKEKIVEKIKHISPEMKTILICTCILCVFVFGIYGIGFNVSEFIYSKF